jgi:hypothetical protein
MCMNIDTRELAALEQKCNPLLESLPRFDAPMSHMDDRILMHTHAHHGPGVHSAHGHKDCLECINLLMQQLAKQQSSLGSSSSSSSSLSAVIRANAVLPGFFLSSPMRVEGYHQKHTCCLYLMYQKCHKTIMTTTSSNGRAFADVVSGRRQAYA